MLRLVVLIVIVVACPSTANIWEKTKNQGKDFHERYQVIPPDSVTAGKLMHYFLSRPDWSSATKNGRTKRQASELDVLFDVAFLIDGSGSLSKRSFKMGLEALKMLIPKARPSTKYAAVTFSDEAEAEFGFLSEAEARSHITNVTQVRGQTNTQAALMKAAELFLNESWGARDDSFKRVLIVTDGKSNIHQDKTLYNAFILKSLGVEIFVVAVGKYIDGIVEIVGLASSTEAHLYRVENLSGLLRVVRLIPEWRVIKGLNQRTWLSNMYSELH